MQPKETMKTNPKLFLKIMGMQTVRPDTLECLLARELARLACLNKFLNSKITKDIYSMNFVNPWKLNPIKDWAHFSRFMRLMKFLEMEWPDKVNPETQVYLEKAPLID